MENNPGIKVKLKVYQDPKQYWNEVSPWLRNNEAVNSLGLGLSCVFTTDPKDCVYQAALFHDEALIGSAIVSRYLTNNNFIPSPTTNPAVAEALLTDVQNRVLPITGIVAETNTAEIYQKIAEMKGYRTKLHLGQGIYQCRKVKVPDHGAQICFRAAGEKDISTIARWIEEFHDEAVPHDPPLNGVEFATARVGKGMVYLLEHKGAAVSMAGWSRDIGTSCSVSFVYTPKEHRKHGYASLVTAKLTEQLLASGKKETHLYTDISNPTSNKIYMEIGYQFVCHSKHLGVYK